MTIDEVHSAKNLCVYGRVAVVGVLLYAWLRIRYMGTECRLKPSEDLIAATKL